MRFILGISFLLILTDLYAQFPQYQAYTNIAGNATYGAPADFPISQVTSDYGPRGSNDATPDWHGGVDFGTRNQSGIAGDLILAIDTGTVDMNVAGDFKYVIIENTTRAINFGYAHLFTTVEGNPAQTVGECVLKRYTNGRDWAIIVPSQFNTRGHATAWRAIGETTGNVMHNNVLLPVNRNVAVRDGIGSMGNSMTRDRGNIRTNFPVHLHLYALANGSNSLADADTKNPLQFLTHANNPQIAFDVSLTSHYNSNVRDDDTTDPHLDNTNAVIETQYPGTENSNLRIKPRMPYESQNVVRYDSAILNLNIVEYRLKRSWENSYQTVFGTDGFATFNLGGNTNSNRTGTIGLNTIDITRGDWTTTGMHPFAYDDNNRSHPFDNFYFSDFATRIHKLDPITWGQNNPPDQFAYTPLSARYNDGTYQIGVLLTDIQGRQQDVTRFPTEEKFITIDNYKPFIKSHLEGSANIRSITLSSTLNVLEYNRYLASKATPLYAISVDSKCVSFRDLYAGKKVPISLGSIF